MVEWQALAYVANPLHTAGLGLAHETCLAVLALVEPIRKADTLRVW